MATYEALQAKQNDLTQQKKLAQRNNEPVNVERVNIEIVLLNKRLRQMHKMMFYPKRKPSCNP